MERRVTSVKHNIITNLNLIQHSEAEVRRLRARIDELKREVASAQDELDTATNSVR